jgi:hypothetical protein
MLPGSGRYQQFSSAQFYAFVADLLLLLLLQGQGQGVE